MRRTVSARLELEVHGPTSLALMVAVASGANLVTETLEVRRGGAVLPVEELVDVHGSRIHRLESDAGLVTVDYRAEVAGRTAPPPHDELDPIVYLRPSRYCESDVLLRFARDEFAGASGLALLDAVVGWVSHRLEYVAGSSTGTDSALHTLEARAGVCRDYAHLVIALLRALDVPARMVAVYAPGLTPMDFHAVVEAWVDERWWLVDATHLAPRTGMLRIATGRDAADIAFLTSHGTDLDLRDVTVTATADPLPPDEVTETSLG
jgi:transglutaminase-like putative cysteine protease